MRIVNDGVGDVLRFNASLDFRIPVRMRVCIGTDLLDIVIIVEDVFNANTFVAGSTTHANSKFLI
ncbi:hypothetical protein ACM41_06340 [Bradyrhizobium sp. CCBAU 21362]|nr:hypothetical protein [Bradyrhizobium sp. CCBAU 21362]